MYIYRHNIILGIVMYGSRLCSVTGRYEEITG